MSSDSGMHVWIKHGQELVERLVHTHANLKLEERLEFYEAGMLPWDVEMTVEEPSSDDVDGVPQCVSDSESECVFNPISFFFPFIFESGHLQVVK